MDITTLDTIPAQYSIQNKHTFALRTPTIDRTQLNTDNQLNRNWCWWLLQPHQRRAPLHSMSYTRFSFINTIVGWFNKPTSKFIIKSAHVITAPSPTRRLLYLLNVPEQLDSNGQRQEWLGAGKESHCVTDLPCATQFYDTTVGVGGQTNNHWPSSKCCLSPAPPPLRYLSIGGLAYSMKIYRQSVWLIKHYHIHIDNWGLSASQRVVVALLLDANHTTWYYSRKFTIANIPIFIIPCCAQIQPSIRPSNANHSARSWQ